MFVHFIFNFYKNKLLDIAEILRCNQGIVIYLLICMYCMSKTFSTLKLYD